MQDEKAPPNFLCVMDNFVERFSISKTHFPNKIMPQLQPIRLFCVEISQRPVIPTLTAHEQRLVVVDQRERANLFFVHAQQSVANLRVEAC